MTPDMKLSALAQAVESAPLWKQLGEGEDATVYINCVAGIRPFLVAALKRRHPQQLVVVVTPTTRVAGQYEKVLSEMVEGVALFPAWETLPHERLSPRSDTMAQRIATAYRLTHPENPGPLGPVSVLVVPVRAFLQPVVSDLGQQRPILLRPGDEVELSQLETQLVELGYQRTDMVERRGQFAVRGGILDVFAPTDARPARLEFFGDQVDEIRQFAVSDQRTFADAPLLWAPPCKEIRPTHAVRSRAAKLQGELPGAAQMLEQISQGQTPEGMESLAPVLVESMCGFMELLPPDSLVVADDPQRCLKRSADLQETSAEFLEAAWSAAASGGKIPLTQAQQASFLSWDSGQEICHKRGLKWWELSSLEATAEDASQTYRIPALPAQTYRGDLTAASQDILKLLRKNWQVVLCANGTGSAKRLAGVLSEAEVPAQGELSLPAPISPSYVHVVPAPLNEGFVCEALKLAVLAEKDLTGRGGTSTREMRKMPARAKGQVVDPLALRRGDLIVHAHHGIGRFIELVKRTTGSAPVTREYLVLEYAPSRRGGEPDRLLVPTDSLDQLTKYSGGENPALSKLGGSDWARTKSKARRAVREIAAELIRLYAARAATKGHAFGPDTPWQQELEDAFEYVETPDQLKTIEEVKADMEKPIPMDRLICGDVGYGKTEIAVRAAFKAIQDGYQVAVLVPTTLLAQQHLETFSERYAGFPVKVAALSRFSTPKQARQVKEGLRDGTIDLVIGTHALITGQVRFKNLGLVVIDEEQRFGVEHKETLKQLRTNVDVLSMSATPIPRTLEMAVSGIRQMSTLATPPEERHPVLTYVGRYSPKQVAAAIRREILREGQVFFVHNRVESIGKVASQLAELVPEARIRVAHGRMKESELENVIVDFWNHDFDVLVCTTIVETGLDIANANTLIVDRADRMGLAGLYQLRGRVGRGKERAYAYFFYPGDTPLTETAHERLSTIATNTDLGSGMAVAMKDLEIRGAGNLLGGEQSGHIAGVGFDLYIQMVAEAVAGFQGKDTKEKAEVKLELPIDARVPEEYIASERLRLETYGKFAAAGSEEELAQLRSELEDRYGPVPPSVELLFGISRLREKARELGVTKISSRGKYVEFSPVELADSQMLRLRRLHPGSLIKTAVRQILVPVPGGDLPTAQPLHNQQLIDWVDGILEHIVKPFGKPKTDPKDGKA